MVSKKVKRRIAIAAVTLGAVIPAGAALAVDGGQRMGVEPEKSWTCHEYKVEGLVLDKNSPVREKPYKKAAVQLYADKGQVIKIAKSCENKYGKTWYKESSWGVGYVYNAHVLVG